MSIKFERIQPGMTLWTVERRWRPDAGGYHNGPAMVRWETETRVPPCEGKP